MNSLHEIIDSFAQAMREHGIETDETITADGHRHRVRVTGDKAGSENGWYVLHADGVPAGAFGCWKRGISATWCAKAANALTTAEREAYKQRMEASRLAQQAEQERVQADCKAKADRLWREASDTVSASHPYLVAKGVKAYGLRQLRDALLVPVMASDGAFVGLQFIQADGSKRFLTGTPKAGSYHRIAGDMNKVLICEGYATGASLHEATGYAVAIAFDAGNLMTVASTLRTKLPDATLVLCADDDRQSQGNPGLTKATAAAHAIGGLLAAPPFAEGETGTDFNDLHQAHGLDAVREAVEAAALAPTSPLNNEQAAANSQTTLFDADGRRKSQATLMIELASELELFKDPQDRGYAIVPIGGARQVLAIRSKPFSAHLEHELYRLTKKGAGGQAKQDAIDTLDAKARFEGDTRETYLRVAATADAVYLDLCDELWRVVEITKSGWQVLAHSPVMFTRRQDMKALPIPQVGGGLDMLRRFVNVTDQDWPLVYGWLLAALRGQKPFPVLILQGEQGSGKSVSAGVLRELVDPLGSPLQAPPRKAEDMAAIAANTYVVALDNLSGMDAEMADGICRLSTGAGISKRQLYTDNDLVTVALARPVIVNGIDQLSSRADLMSRSVMPDLPLMPDSEKGSEIELWQSFYNDRPLILGALLQMLANGLKGFQDQLAPSVGRLRDWARLVTASERVSGIDSGFARAYGANIHSGAAKAVEASTFSSAVLRLAVLYRDWQGTATDLLKAVRDLTDEIDHKARDFPNSNRAVSNYLTRAAPALRSMGVSISHSHGQQRLIRITKLEQGAKTSSLSSLSSKPLRLLGSEASNIVATSSLIHDDNKPTTISDDSNDDTTTISRRLKASNGAPFDDNDDNDDKTRAYSSSWNEGAI